MQSIFRGKNKTSVTDKENLPQDYIVIGSGITGLCAGALLSKTGYKVTVLEAHPEYLGGHARTLQVHGKKFCAGPQFVWNFIGNNEETGTKVLRYLGIEDAVPFRFFDRACQDRVFLGDHEVFDIPQGLERFQDSLLAQFPENGKSIKRFFIYLDSIFEGTIVLHDQGLYMAGKWGMLWALFASKKLTLKQKIMNARLHKKTLSEVFDICKLSDKPRRILYAHGGIFAENPETISIGIYAAATGYCHKGVAYPERGFDSLILGLSSSISDTGGTVYLNKKVNKINIKDGFANRVECTDGTVFPCDHIISTLSPRLTCALITGCDFDRYHYAPSNSLLSCYIGLKDYPDLSGLERKNYWWQTYPDRVDYDNPDMEKKPSMLFIGSETENGIIYQAQNQELQTITVFTPGNFRQARETYHQGPEAYQKLKDNITKSVLDTIEEFVFKDLSSYVKFIEVFTPWDIYQELGAEWGNVYGRKVDVWNLLRKVKRIKGVKNLDLACATIGMPGVETGFQTAVLLFNKITGQSL